MIESIERLLKTRIGLDAESVGRTVIERAVRQRMGAGGHKTQEDYWIALNGSPREQQQLVEAVVVPETWFFRYPDSFNVLARLAIEQRQQLTTNRPLRLISVPCSTGEEPYSMVMCLLDAGLNPSQFQVDAIDISEHSLNLARTGVYGRNSFRGGQAAQREHFFRDTEKGLQLHDNVLSQVKFRNGNLLDANLFLGQEPYDFIFCRNLLIYFDRHTQGQVLERLKQQLAPGGTLFIGPAEASLATQNGLQAIGHAQTFAFRLAPAKPVRPTRAAPHKAPARSVSAPPNLAKTPPPKPRSPARPARPAPSGTSETPDHSAFFADIAQLANAGRSDDAQQRLSLHLQRQGPSAEAYYWLGLLSDVAGDSAQACAYYRKTIYLQPAHREALTHLAAHLESQGDLSGAQRLYRRAQGKGGTE